MTATVLETWQEDNRLYLASVLDELYLRLLGDPHCSDTETGPALSTLRATADQLATTMTEPPALVRLVEVFGLDAFGRDVVAWCAGFALDPRYRAGGPPRVGPALSGLSDPSWWALHAAAPLRRSGLIEVEEEPSFADAALRLGRDVLVYLLGLPAAAGPFVVEDIAPTAPPNQEALAGSIVGTLQAMGGGAVVALHGATVAERRLVVQLCARHLTATVLRLDERDISLPDGSADRVFLDWNRMVRLTSGVPLLELGGGQDDDGQHDPARGAALRRALLSVDGPLFVSSATPAVVDPSRPMIRRAVELPPAQERLGLWEVGLDALPPPLCLVQTAFQYHFDSASIAAICAEAIGVAQGDGERTNEEIQAGCRRLARTRLEPVAERVVDDSDVTVVVPPHQRQQLAELEAHIRLSYQVTTAWGMGGTPARGVAALFAGPSGTGKTMAASVIARHVGLDLYRVNLATVMSKYIGETEKNLQRIFDAAAAGGAILLFDEADALFGKRSEVKDSHDRYANIATAYLLQKVEQAVTPTILTTNIKDAIDPAFARRLHFVVDFPFPDAQAREQIWRDVYPSRTPTRGIDPTKLASLAVNGASIRKIALRAAFLAAERGDVVEMSDVMESSHRELRQSGRALGPEEVAGWL